MKEIAWVGSSLKDIRAFPDSAKMEAGYQLYKLQVRRQPDDWKPMKGIGPGVEEIRIHSGGEYRIIYVARLKGAVYVLHCFQKKTGKTAQRDIDIARERYRGLLEEKRTK